MYVKMFQVAMTVQKKAASIDQIEALDASLCMDHRLIDFPMTDACQKKLFVVGRSFKL